MINGILYKLQTTASVTAYVPAGRILPLVQMQGDETPAILVDLEGVRTNENKSATSRADDNDVSVIVIAETAKQAYLIASEVRDTLDGFAGESDGVQIAETRFLNWATDQDDGGRLFVLTSAYVVTTYRAGATAIVQGTSPTGAIRIKESDGAPDIQASTLVVPNGSLTTENNTATLSFALAGTSIYAAAAKQSTNTTNIGSTAVTLGIDTEIYDTANEYVVTSNQLRTPEGRHLIFVHCNFEATTNHELPHVRLMDATTTLAEGTGYVTGQHGDDHTSVSITHAATGALRLKLDAYNEADGNDEVVCTSAQIQVITFPS